MRCALLLAALANAFLLAPALAQRSTGIDALARALLAVPAPEPRGPGETSTQYHGRVLAGFDTLVVEGMSIAEVLRLRRIPSEQEVRFNDYTGWMSVRFAGSEVTWPGGQGRTLFQSVVDGTAVHFVARDTVLRAENEYACAVAQLSGYDHDEFLVPRADVQAQRSALAIEYDIQVVPPYRLTQGEGVAYVPVRLLGVRIINRLTDRLWSSIDPDAATAHAARMHTAEGLYEVASEAPRLAVPTPFSPPVLENSPSTLRTVVSVVVETDGRVSFSCVERTNDLRYSAALLDWVEASTFQPGTRGGVPVRAATTVAVDVPLWR